MPQKILILAAHSDDEVLGCGGTIARKVSEGNSVSVIFLTDGVSSRGTEADEASMRKSASVEALKNLGVSESHIHRFDLPDNAIDSLPLIEVVKKIQTTVDSIQPDVIYTHQAGDLNVDHRAAHDATMVIARPQPGCSIKEVYTFEVASSTAWNGISPANAFIPNYYTDISDHWDAKKKALEAYDGEMRPAPHARSIEGLEALARYRGSQVGLSMAEAFCVERIIA